MTEPPSIQRQRALLTDLVQTANSRAKAEADTEQEFHDRHGTVEREFEQGFKDAIVRFATGKEAVEKEYEETCQTILQEAEAAKTPIEEQYNQARQKILDQSLSEKEEAKNVFQEARMTLAMLFEGNKNEAEEQVTEIQGRIGSRTSQIQEIQREAKKMLEDWRHDPEAAKVMDEEEATSGSGRLRNLQDCLADAEALMQALNNLSTPRWARGLRLVWVFGLLAIGGAVLAYYYLDPQFRDYGMGGAAVAALILCWIARKLLYGVARSQVCNLYGPLCLTVADAETSRKRALDLTASTCEKQVAEFKKRHDFALRRAYKKYKNERAEIKRRRDEAVRLAHRDYRQQKTRNKKRRELRLRQAEETRQRRQADNKARYDLEVRLQEEKHQKQSELCAKRHDAAWQALADAWAQGLERVHHAVSEIQEESQRIFPDWTNGAVEGWTAPAAVPSVVRFGAYHVSLDQVPQGIPADEELLPDGPVGFSLPAFMSFPDRCSLLFKASDEGRDQAVQAIQGIMLRLLTSLPPAKVRFTIIDPVGLGQNFSAFMHLADYDEALVNSRIWTEQSHIEQRLADLTEHMENVIQKYLRNQFQSIEEYNAHAGEVAEPFRFLVVANFPAHFSAEASRRLLSIASSGARCGVYTLISVDTKLPLIQQGINLADLEKHSVNLMWQDGQFRWLEPDFGKYPLQLDMLPEAESTTRLLQIVGQKAKEAARVEVPFEYIAPPAEQWWTSDSRKGIQVALGRSGATKRQALKLGQGTSHHVLIAGKTGSGKSTLLHALITNLSLLYSPDEVEMYLVDFKEGVEFKAYATHELPHARLVAIESEREFGLSVLQRLDGELKQRGDKFRDLGVQDINAFREGNPGVPLPRIMLIVDEFQLFFVEDDKIAQEAALLLDRLVRQGRAFGIHVLLGSQTLGGAYSLARSTIGQMAVRIALQCNETDAHLILSEDNAAARLLSRPGEAIYNDANGLVEGNNFFQVVWLNDLGRERYLERIQDLARERHYVPPHAQIVFEGNAPAEVAKNDLLNQLLESADWPTTIRSAQAWLGEALAIKDATAALFRPQSGSNLLMVGQAEEAALGVLATAVISLGTQHAPAEEADQAGAVRFYILDASPPDLPHADLLGRFPELLPHPVRVGSWRDLTAIMVEVSSEVDRRHQGHSSDYPVLYLVIHGLHRFRDLRRSDDDFGFTRRGEEKEANPAKLFSNIMREGPPVGVHTLIWCDTLNNVTRALDRQGLREFEMRVLFQMSAADSSTLIDTPAASKLGIHRALFYSEERGQPEKFRPYGIPSPAWLEQVRHQFKNKKVPART